jgi:hypothetical protein
MPPQPPDYKGVFSFSERECGRPHGSARSRRDVCACRQPSFFAQQGGHDSEAPAERRQGPAIGCRSRALVYVGKPEFPLADFSTHPGKGSLPIWHGAAVCLIWHREQDRAVGKFPIDLGPCAGNLGDSIFPGALRSVGTHPRTPIAISCDRKRSGAPNARPRPRFPGLPIVAPSRSGRSRTRYPRAPPPLDLDGSATMSNPSAIRQAQLATAPRGSSSGAVK